MGRLHHDMFQQERLVLNKVDINIILSQSENEFCLLCSCKKEYKVMCKDLIILVKGVSAITSTAIGIEKTLERGRVKYVVDNIDCKVFTVPPRNCSVMEDRFFKERNPTEFFLTVMLLRSIQYKSS